MPLSLSFKGAFYVLCFENLGHTSKGKLPLNTKDNLVFSLKILKTHTTPWTEHLPLEQQSLQKNQMKRWRTLGEWAGLILSFPDFKESLHCFRSIHCRFEILQNSPITSKKQFYGGRERWGAAVCFGRRQRGTQCCTLKAANFELHKNESYSSQWRVSWWTKWQYCGPQSVTEARAWLGWQMTAAYEKACRARGSSDDPPTLGEGQHQWFSYILFCRWISCFTTKRVAC